MAFEVAVAMTTQMTIVESVALFIIIRALASVQMNISVMCDKNLVFISSSEMFTLS